MPRLDDSAATRESGVRLDRDDRRAMAYLGLACLAYYLLILGGHHYSIDGIVLFQTAKAMVFQHSLSPQPPVHWMGEPRAGYWGIGVSLAYVPWLLLWFPLFTRFPTLQAVPYDPRQWMNPALNENIPYLLCSLLNPVVTAGTACLVFALGRTLGLTRRWALAAALAFGLASPAAVYARQDFGQPLAALLLTAAVYALLRSTGESGLGSLFVTGASLGYALLVRIELTAAVPWLALWAFAQHRWRGATAAAGRASIVALVPAFSLLLGLWLRRIKVGGPPIPPWRGAAALLLPDSAGDVLIGLAGHLVSPGRGVLVYFPLAWLVIPGLLRLARSRRAAAVLVGGLIALLLAVFATFRIWWAGVSWGPRFLVPLLPLMAVAAAWWPSEAARRRRAWPAAVFAVLAALGLVVSWNAILVDPNDYAGWVLATRHVSLDAGPVQFDLRASPLVSGWPMQTGLPLDLFWVRLWEAGHMEMFRDPLAMTRIRHGLDLSLYGRVVAVGAPLALFLALGWAIRGLLVSSSCQSATRIARVTPPSRAREPR